MAACVLLALSMVQAASVPAVAKTDPGQKAVKQQQKAMKKYLKQQRKAMKKAQKNAQKEAKRARKNQYKRQGF